MDTATANQVDKLLYEVARVRREMDSYRAQVRHALEDMRRFAESRLGELAAADAEGGMINAGWAPQRAEKVEEPIAAWLARREVLLALEYAVKLARAAGADPEEG